MQTRLVLREDEVGLEADYIVQKSSKLVNLTFHDDVGTRVVFQVLLVLLNLLLKYFCSFCQAIYLVAKLEYRKEVLLIRKLFLHGNSSLKVLTDFAKSAKCLLGKILGRRGVLLDTFKVLDSEESLLSLLVYDGFKLVILMLDLFYDLFLDAFLLHHDGLHG